MWINFIFIDNVRKLCLSCNIKNPKQLPNCLKIAETSVVLIVFNDILYHVRPYTVTILYCRSTASSITSVLIQLPYYTVALRHPLSRPSLIQLPYYTVALRHPLSRPSLYSYHIILSPYGILYHVRPYTVTIFYCCSTWIKYQKSYMLVSNCIQIYNKNYTFIVVWLHK